MNENPLLKHVWESWLPEVGILLLFWVSRVWNILSLAAYIDEGILIFRIRDIERGRRVFVSLARNGKWLQPAGLSLLSLDGPETLWVMRFSSALLAMFACVACIGLGRMLASRGGGRLAGLFYILPALGFLHERTALADVWLSAFSALAMVAAARLALERRAYLILPLALAMAAAILSKVSAVTVLGVPLAAALLLPRSGSARRRALLQATVAVALASSIVVALVAVAQSQRQSDSKEVEAGTFPVASVCRHSFVCAMLQPDEDAAPLTPQLMQNLSEIPDHAERVVFLVGPPMLSLAFASLLALRGARWRGIAFVWLVLLSRVGALLAVARRLPIRNLLFILVPLVVLAALLVETLWRLPRWSHRAAQPVLRIGYSALVVGGALAAMLWSLPMDVTFLRHPPSVVIPDYPIYECSNEQEVSYAYGYDDAAQTLRAWAESHPGRVNVVVANDKKIAPYWGPRVGTIREWRDRSQSLLSDVALWVLAGESVFFVDKVPVTPIPDEPYRAIVETVAVHPLPCRGVEVRVRRLVNPGPDVRHRIYEIVFPSPHEYADQYRAIAQHLIDSEAQGIAVVYPPHQLELLDARLQWGTTLDGVVVVGDSWPLDTVRAAETLESLAAEHGQLHVVLLQEDLGDPDHAIESWLDANMQRTSELWFGPVRLLSYDP